MKTLINLVNWDILKRYSDEIYFIRDVTLIEIKKVIRKSERDDAVLVEEFSFSYYENIIEEINSLKKLVLFYKKKLDYYQEIMDEYFDSFSEHPTKEIEELAETIKSLCDLVDILLLNISSEVDELIKKQNKETK